MKVCFVSTSFPRSADDDRAAFVFSVARGLQAQGATVRVVTLHTPGSATHEFIENIEIYRARYLYPEQLERLQLAGGGLPETLRRSPIAWLALAPFALAQCAATARFGRDGELIHAFWTLSAASVFVSRPIHRKPYVVTVQGSDIFRLPRNRFARGATRMALSSAHRVLCLSQALADSVRALGVEGAKIEVVPNGVDLEKFHAGDSARDKSILYVGSLIPRKGLTYLLRAMARILHQLPDYRLVIAGEGPLWGPLRNEAEHLGIAPSVEFLGRQTHTQVAALMRRARVFVLPSLEEGLGQVLLEALASATPVVGTAVGGIPDIIVPDVGALTLPADADALAEAIISVSNDEQRWAVFSREARSRARSRFNARSIAERLLDIYREAIEAQNPPRLFTI